MKVMFLLFFSVWLIAPVYAISSSKKEEKIFKFYLRSEPQSFDPAQFWGSETTYLFSQVFRGLYRFDDEKGLVPEGAKKCEYTSDLKIICELNPKVKYQNGEPVKAQDYVKAFRHLLNPNSKSRDNSHLINLKNARKILLSKSPLETLGITAKSDYILEFDFEEPDFEFLEKLSSAMMIPWLTLPDIDNPQNTISNGPYIIESFVKNQKVSLKTNKHYPFGNPHRPKVEIYFLNDDVTIQNLFDTGKIDFVSRVDVTIAKAFEKHPGISKVKFSRFDYVSFGPEIQGASMDFRKALVHSLDYDKITKLFNTGRFGCVGLSDNLLEKRHCYEYKPEDSKKTWKSVPENLKTKKYFFKISQAGGDNVFRTAEWYENQWKTNLGFKILVDPIEQGMYLQTLKNNTPDIFRKGINLDRPTCLSAIEGFYSKSEENYIKFNSPQFDEKIKKLTLTKDLAERKKLCTYAIQILMDEYRIIPQGEVVYTMLSNGKFKNIEFNQLNQLDLSNLQSVK